MICQFCGGVSCPDDVTPELKLCEPNDCPTWQTLAVYDHEQRAWLRTDDDGFLLDGRHAEDV